MAEWIPNKDDTVERECQAFYNSARLAGQVRSELDAKVVVRSAWTGRSRPGDRWCHSPCRQ